MGFKPRSSDYRFASTQFAHVPLQPTTSEFLTSFGLPGTAEPGFSFFTGAHKFTTLYSTNSVPAAHKKQSFDHYVIIGHHGYFRVCIDTKNKDRIVGIWQSQNELRHNPISVNHSIEALASCLTLFRDFVANVNQTRAPAAASFNTFFDRSKTAFQWSLYKRSDVTALQNKLAKIDSTLQVPSNLWMRILDEMREHCAQHRHDRSTARLMGNPFPKV